MFQNFMHFFRLNGIDAILEGDHLWFDRICIPLRNGIPRFTPDTSYSSGNFARLREHHAKLQLDSVNGTTDRLDTILNRTNWPPSFFLGKTVLECGCGAGPDSEILLSLGARVLSIDLVGLDVTRANIGENPDHCLVQADITKLPLGERSFDIVFCHRVLQHTPDPEHTLRHILRFVKPRGAVFIHSYSRSIYQMFRWKYAIRPVTKRISSEQLYNFIKWYSPAAYRLTTSMKKTLVGRIFTYLFIPFLNYGHLSQFAGKDDAWILEFGVHDTFDALSPAYDIPISARKMQKIAAELLDQPFEIITRKTITLLRTIH